jgi:hypothetical protein
MYSVFPHSADWAISTTGDAPQLGGYFRSAEDVTTALDVWGSSGWYVPNIVLKWEDFVTGINEKQSGWRITNSGFSATGANGLSAVVAVKQAESTL